MGWLDRMFGGGSKSKGEAPSRGREPAKTEAPSHQLPSSVVCPEFGEVNVRKTREGTEVSFTILMEPEGSDAEGWQTGVALDASASMQNSYGHGLVTGPAGQCPPNVIAQYERNGWIRTVNDDGKRRTYWGEEAFNDAIKRGYMESTPNVVEPVAREFIAYLAGQLDADGGTTVIYWACGDGAQFEVLGDFTADQCKELTLVGPAKIKFGGGTQLTPAVKYFVDRFADAERGMYVFVTDGRLDDLDAVKRYTTQLAREIQAKKRNSVKCVLVGIGDDVDEGQMEELDDLDTGTDVDIWDHKIAKEMRSLVEIFAEVVSENKIVAPTAAIYDESGKVVVNFSDGLPAKVSFTLPSPSTAFELEVGGRRIKQTVKMP